MADHLLLAGLTIQGIRSLKVETSVGRMHVLDMQGTGDLPPVVLLHGLSAASVYFGSLLRRLRSQVRRVIAPDLPGHGFSETPKEGLNRHVLQDGLFEVLDQVLEEPALVFGNSLGGISAVLYALSRPERVRGLMLCSPGGARIPPEEFQDLLNTFRVDTHAEALAFVDRLFTHPNVVLRPLIAMGVRQKLSHPMMRTFVDQATLDDMLLPEQLRRLQVPVLLMWGKNERILPESNLDFYRENLPPHASVELPEGYGHSPYLEYPNAVSRRILSFLGECQARRALPMSEESVAGAPL